MAANRPASKTSQQSQILSSINPWHLSSGDSDVVTHYDASFSPIESFSGTAASGFGAGEGVAVIGDSLYVAAASTARIVEFDVADSSLIFTDGFEAGTTDAWSATVP